MKSLEWKSAFSSIIEPKKFNKKKPLFFYHISSKSDEPTIKVYISNEENKDRYTLPGFLKNDEIKEQLEVNDRLIGDISSELLIEDNLYDVSRESGRYLLGCLIKSGRLKTFSGQPISLGSPIIPIVNWSYVDGLHKPCISYPANGHIIRSARPVFFAKESLTLHKIAVESAQHLEMLETFPSLSSEEIKVMAFELKSALPFLELPESINNKSLRVVPKILLRFTKTSSSNRGKLGAELLFDYQGFMVDGEEKPHSLEVVETPNGDIDLYYDKQTEKETFELLKKWNLIQQTARKNWYNPVTEMELTSGNLNQVDEGMIGDTQEIMPWYNIVKNAIPALKEAGIKVTRTALFNLEFFDAKEISTVVDREKRHNKLELSMKLTTEDGDYETILIPILIELINKYQNNLEEIPDKIFQKIYNNKWFVIPKSLVIPALRTLNLVYRNQNARGGKIKIEQFDAGQLVASDENQKVMNFKVPDDVTGLANALRNPDSIEKVNVPQGIQVTPHDYQMTGLNWLYFLKKHGLAGLMADEMGAGKSMQLIMLMLLSKEKALFPDKPHLVVINKTGVDKWLKEIDKMTAGNLVPIPVYSGEQQKLKEAALKPKNNQVFVTTYHTVRTMLDIFKKIEFDIVVPDESQWIKNPSAGITKAIHSLKKESGFCISGTPLENITTDIWSQLEFSIPNLLGSIDFFQKNYARPLKKEDISKESKIEALTSLSHRISPFILSRGGDTVTASLPPLIEDYYELDMSKDYQRLYSNIRQALNKDVYQAIKELGQDNAQGAVLNAYRILRDLACDGRICDEGRAAGLSISSKTEFIIDMTEKSLSYKRKVIIFSSFTRYLNLIKDDLENKGIVAEMISGESNQSGESTEILDRFKSDEFDVILITFKAGGAALDIYEANTVISAEPFWNPFVEKQAVKRAHRQGQNDTVYFYRPIIKDSIEEYILKVQSDKTEMAKIVLQGASENIEDAIEKIGESLDSSITSIESIKAVFGESNS
jgi:superfamily II DNA or RNA helicase